MVGVGVRSLTAPTSRPSSLDTRTNPTVSPLRVTIITQSPSPYQVEFLDALALDPRVEVRVVYVLRSDASRHWQAHALDSRWSVALCDGRTAADTAGAWSREADVTVFSWYDHPLVRRLIVDREASRKAWCYWGERPGFSRWKTLSRWRRRFLLRTLARSKAPIWGIGAWAVDGWRTEFGERRRYFNVPYFSDLRRFARPVGAAPEADVRRVLFSGTLSHRKGVDLLARAFAVVARQRPQFSLDVLGSGDLRSMMDSTLRDVSERVRFLGFKQWSELPAVYHAADFLCAPSRYDGWGLIVPEGLAAGLPVIATDRMGAAIDLVEEGINGWRIAADDQSALERALRTAASLSDGELAVMSAAARDAAERHSLQSGVDRIYQAAVETLCVFQ